MVRHSPTKKSAAMSEVARHLEEWGATVDVIYPEEQLSNLERIRPSHDLYLLKSRTALTLSYAGVLHWAGATILNPYPVASMMRDKIVATKVLKLAGVPVPETFVTSDPKLFASLLDSGPIIVKPYRGSRGHGIHIVWDVDELDDLTTEGGVIFAQRYYQPDGKDRKIFCIGGQFFGVRRPWPARSYEEKAGEPFSVTPALRQIAERVGQAFGIELYGLDIIEHDGEPIVVDVSAFPGFKGVPDAGLRVADYVFAAAERVLRGEPLIPPKSTPIPPESTPMPPESPPVPTKVID
jgi:ribosomal protein S6--L-glutamate ligase